MPDLNAELSSSQRRPISVGVLALFATVLSSLGAAISAQEHGIQILLEKESVSVGSTVLCSEDELEAALSEHAKDVAIHVENSPGVETVRVLKLLQVIRVLGYENITWTSLGEPGWTLYPSPDDLDVFACEENRK